jgi:hypothetical protein
MLRYAPKYDISRKELRTMQVVSIGKQNSEHLMGRAKSGYAQCT